MTVLANSSAESIFVIPEKEWTAINMRVGEVLTVQKIQSTVASFLPGYPSLLSSSQLWQHSTFNSLISESGDVAKYIDKSISNFTNLKIKVDNVKNDDVPKYLQVETLSLLQILADDTNALATASKNLSSTMIAFLNDNKVVDAQIAKSKNALGIFWNGIGDIINTLENAAGHVTGSWQAIADDLNVTLASPISVTMPFIESLNIEAALVQWQSLKSEATAFPSMVGEQSKYWGN